MICLLHKFLYAAALFVFCGCVAANKLSGKYVSAGSFRGVMNISENHGVYRITIAGGGQSVDVDNVSGDCEAVAEGKMKGKVLYANLIPFNGEVIVLDKKDVERLKKDIVVSFDLDGAVVSGDFSYCGLRNVLSGKYRRID